MERQAVILCGGLATRLGAIAATTPKYLVEVAGRPFAERQLRRLAESGYTRAVLCVGHLSGAIEAALGASHEGIALTYSHDGEVARGTGGALHRALPHLDATFLVLYGDSYLPFDHAGPLDDLRAHPEALGTMSVFRNDGRFDRSNVRVEGERVMAYDDGTGPYVDIDYGATALRRTALEARGPEPFAFGELQRALASAGSLRAFRAEERFYEVGSPAGLAALQAKLEGAP